MRKSKPFLILLALIVSAPADADAQATARSMRRTESRIRPGQRLNTASASGFATRASRNRPGVGGIRAYGGVSSRSDQIRAELARMINNQRDGLLAAPPSSIDPIYNMMSRRNLLRSRSALAERTASIMGHQDYILQDGKWAGAVQPPAMPIWSPSTATMREASGAIPPPMPDVYEAPKLGMSSDGPPMRTYNSMLASQLGAKGEQYLREGLDFFANKQYSQAQQKFELYQQTTPESPHPLALLSITSYQQRDFNLSILFLAQALQRMYDQRLDRLDDLRVDPRVLYPDPNDFRRIVDESTLIAKLPGSSPRSSLLMAYFQLLNGSPQTALSALDTAIVGIEAEARAEEQKSGQGSVIDRTSHVKWFRELVRKTMSGPSGAEVSAPAPR
ncbi:MAG: hypothetical protein KF841_05190 [Phycisphaerae bacterium]|nr:hypothetical protein [Phycisphaerae bacterium]